MPALASSSSAAAGGYFHLFAAARWVRASASCPVLLYSERRTRTDAYDGRHGPASGGVREDAFRTRTGRLVQNGFSSAGSNKAERPSGETATSFAASSCCAEPPGAFAFAYSSAYSWSTSG